MQRGNDRKLDSIVCIGAGKSQLPLILTGKRMGVSVIAVDQDETAVGFPYSDLNIRESTHDTAGVLTALKRQASAYSVKGVVARTTAAEALHTAAAVSREYKVPGLTPELIRLSTEKSSLREFCSLRNIPVPAGIRMCSREDIPEHLKLPAIVKPDRTASGKAGILFCRERRDLFHCVDETAQASDNHCVEIESFIAGIDASCLCSIRNGRAEVIAWWDELVGIDLNDRIVGLGLSVPSVISGTEVRQRAEQVAKTLVSHFADVAALLLVSFRITNEGHPYVIELHADLGGDLIADVLLPEANPHFDFFALALQVATGTAGHLAPIDFSPTALYYRRKKQGIPRASSDPFNDCEIYRHGNVKANLDFLPEHVKSQGLELSVRPQHREWLKRHDLQGNQP